MTAFTDGRYRTHYLVILYSDNLDKLLDETAKNCWTNEIAVWDSLKKRNLFLPNPRFEEGK